MAERPFAAELAEIAQIDYLLDNLARAVERGEVPRRSYELMAPRYLARRGDLVAQVTGSPAQAPSVPAVAPTPGVVPVTGPDLPRLAAPARVPFLGAHPARATRERVVVDWPTVLLFLGAFLVIVASAIFSVAVWGALGTLEKFGFLGALTLAFYGAGAWALKRLNLPVGAIALTAVASGMLLFDGWILIDGYGLEGPLPWAVLALFCSAVYFLTELMLAGRLFGVIGAAAQIAWWWLLGDGIGLTEPTRLAGIALVALAWQIAAERGRGRARVGPLASVLAWGAPIVSTACGAGFMVDLAISGPATAQVVAAAVVVSAAAGLVLGRSDAVPRPVRMPLAAVLQVPLLAAAWSSAFRIDHAWWLVLAFAAAASVYYLVAFRPLGVSFVGLGLFAELSAVFEVCLVLDLSVQTTVTVIAILAAIWALTARLLDRWADRTVAPIQSRRIALIVEVGALLLLAVTSLSVPVVTWTVPLPFADVSRVTALAYVGVLAAWWACSVARPRDITSFSGTLWAYVTLSAVLSWVLPADYSWTLFMVPFVVLSGIWLAASSRPRDESRGLWGEVNRWAARAAAFLFSVVGLAVASNPIPYAATPEGIEALGALALLAVVAVGLFTSDALLARCVPSAASAAILTAISAFVLASAVVGVIGAGNTRPVAIVASGASALVVAAFAAAVRRHETTQELAPWFTLAGAGMGTVLVAGASYESGVWTALAWALLALAWLLAASVTSQVVVTAAGLSAAISVWQALGNDPSAWVVLLAMGVTGVALGLPSFARPCRSGGRFEQAGIALALVGVGVHAYLAGTLPPESHTTAVALLVLATNGAVMSALRDFEPGYYAAGFALVPAAWVEVGMMNNAPAVLYSIPLALYLVAASYLYVGRGAGRHHPLVLDALATIVGLGYPVLVTLRAVGARSLPEALATIALSLVAIALGVGLKVRWYFFGGVTAVATVAFYRSFAAIAEYWWLVLGIVGTAMLVVALTWQRQRLLVADARSWLARSFEGWR